ncbi:MAG: tRNA (N(6)-L-threonylcarbamoyladenosine(37)-C(2))-methylthiotransferase MtaB [Anaerolineales bacterium]|nr:tRNA (N(6)-L-threonylcarbamoyladenosine(37)-C(2))-methylthiotransferase MtaB [Anaerolineales bacterium]
MKVSVDSIGCRLNQAEMRSLGWQLEENGVELTQDFEESDIIVLNTCTVTAKAAADSRGRIRAIRKKNPSARLIITGCWATMESDVAARLVKPEDVVSNNNKASIADLILKDRKSLPAITPVTDKPAFRRTRAFVKVQDGCNSHCAYCITTIARGRSTSVPVAHVVDQVEREVKAGVKEVVLTGVQLNSYGRDLADSDLTTLIRALLAYTDIPRIRLSSIEPWNLPDTLFELWKSPRLCRHLHLPLQSGSNETLQRMRRPYTTEQYTQLLQHALQAIPGVAISTDIITGFPGETAEEFEASLAFVEQSAFAHGHVFSYSPRPHTAAQAFPGRVTERIVKERTHRMRAVIHQKQELFRRSALNTELEVLWERAVQTPEGSWLLSGWSDTYLRALAESSVNHSNQISRVLIVDSDGKTLTGRLPE